MVPETPHLKSCWTGTQIKSSSASASVSGSGFRLSQGAVGCIADIL
jgi:hypothetical protein